MKRWRGVLGRFSALLFLFARSVPAQDAATNSPLYLLTYDHGGLVLWGTQHFAERLRDAVSWLDRYPHLKIGLDNEAYMYDYLAEQDPALLEELRGDLKNYRGRFGIGTCTYGQPLSSFINDESNIRQIQYAIRTERKLLDCAPTIYLMSEHAMHSQIPQILDGLGFRAAVLRTHFMMYGYNPTFDVPIGWWIGLDGSRIPAVPTYPGEGAAFGTTTLDNWFLTRYPGPEVKTSPEQYRKQFAHIQPLLATRADDSGLRKEDLIKEYDNNPEYRWLLAEELPGAFPKPTAEMRTLPNDFTVRMPWGYCGNEIWNLSREAETQVMTAERLASLELLLGGTNREADLERAWKNLLVGQHHDVQICGLLPDARRFLSASLAASTNVISASLGFVSARMKGDGIQQVTVFNPVSWPRREWVETDFNLSTARVRILSVFHNDRTVPTVLLHANRRSDGNLVDGRLAFLADVPPLSFAAYSIRPDQGQPKALAESIEIDSANLRIKTPKLDVQLDPEGGIRSLIDRPSGVPLFTIGKRSGFFAGRIDGKDCESHGRWTLHSPGEPGPWATAREYGFIGSIPFTLEVRFWADRPRLDCKVSFHFDGEKIGLLSNDPRDGKSPFLHEYKLRFKLFPAVGGEAKGLRDLPFAISQTTNRYLDGIYWTALVDPRVGLAFLNRGTMGAVREDDGGFSIPLAYAMYYIWGTRMLTGDYSYEFAISPFAGEQEPAGLHREALAYNFPVVSMTSACGTGKLEEIVSPIEVSSENPLVSALYPDKNRVYARLFEYEGRKPSTRLNYHNRNTQLVETDLLDTEKQPVSNPLSFEAWQFRTFRLDTIP